MGSVCGRSWYCAPSKLTPFPCLLLEFKEFAERLNRREREDVEGPQFIKHRMRSPEQGKLDNRNLRLAPRASPAPAALQLAQDLLGAAGHRARHTGQSCHVNAVAPIGSTRWRKWTSPCSSRTSMRKFRTRGSMPARSGSS